MILQKMEQPKQRQEVELLPDTEAATVLQTINVKPAQIAELAHMPLATVEAAIADGRARPGVRDLAGWVVSLLRAHRDYGWRITPPTSAPDSPERLRDAFARYAAEQAAEQSVVLVDVEPRSDDSPTPESGASSLAIRKLWNSVLATMQVQVPRTEFNTWIRRSDLVLIDNGIATICAPSAFVKDGLERRYAGTLRDVLRMLVGSPIQVRIVSEEQDAAAASGENVQAIAASRSASSQDGTQTRAPEQGTPEEVVNHRPDWIAVDEWTSLPAMLRAALIGSTMVDGAVQTISSHLDKLIATRYMREVAALMATAAPAIGPGSAVLTTATENADPPVTGNGKSI